MLRSMMAGGLGPPIRYLFGLAPTSAEPGGVTFTMLVTDLPSLALRQERREQP